MISYFENFPTIEYPYLGKMVQSNKRSTVRAVDLSVRFKVLDEILKSPKSYYEYVWRDGERPDQVAFNYYEDENLAWLVMLSANIFDWVYDLPMNTDVFYKYLESKYGVSDYNELSSIIHHYEDSRGYILDSAGYATSGDTRKRIVSVFDYEFEANESRRVVKLIDKMHAGKVVMELKNSMDNIKNSRRLLGV